MALRSETLSLVISGDGARLGSAIGKSESRLKAFAGKAGGLLAGVGKKLTGAIGKMASNPLALVGGTAGILMAAKNLADYQDSLSTLGITAGLSAGDMLSLDNRIHGLAYSTGQSREAMVGAMKEIASDTDAQFAQESIEAVSKAATALSVDIGDAASAFIAFRRDMGATAEEAEKMFNSVAAMDSSFDFKRLSTSAQTLGLTKDNFADYNAWVQTIKPNFGGVEGAAKAIDNIAMSLQTDKRFRHVLGPDILNADGTVKDFRKMITKISGMSANTRKVMFGGFGKAFLPFADGKGFEAFDEYIKKGEDASFVASAFARKQGEAKFQMNALTSAAKEFAGAALSPLLADLTARMKELTGDPEKMEAFRDKLAGIGETAGSLAQTINALLMPLKAWGDMWEWLGDKWGKLEVGGVRSGGYASATKNASRRTGGSRAVTPAEPAAPRDEPAVSASRRGDRRRQTGASRLSALPPAAAAVSAPPPDVNNVINLNLQVTEGGRVITKSDNANTHVQANVNRGGF